MDLAEKIRKIEALIAGTSSEGERRAAELAKQRIQEKTVVQPIEYSVRVDGLWKKKLFMAICQKYGLSTYRYSGQKRTTTMVRVAKPFMDQVLWPEYNKHAQVFDELVLEVMNDLIAKIHQVNDTDEVEITGSLPLHTVGSAGL
jgi:hypothetical protein